MVYGGWGPRLGSLLASRLPGTSLFDRSLGTPAYGAIASFEVRDCPAPAWLGVPKNARSFLGRR
jgi:hypothetical protein